MNRRIDILIGDFNLLSHLEMLKRKTKSLLHSYVLLVEYDKTIKVERSRERVKQLIDDWNKINKEKIFPTNFLLKVLGVKEDLNAYIDKDSIYYNILGKKIF